MLILLFMSAMYPCSVTPGFDHASQLDREICFDVGVLTTLQTRHGHWHPPSSQRIHFADLADLMSTSACSMY